ncbi:MAG TPA: response regulator [Pirellulales bacterium]|nr:response regulator [Pirellulales bacterium]
MSESDPATKNAKTSGPSLRLLVIDDNHDAADTMAMLLRVMGHQASVAYSGATGVERAIAESPDAVILDLGLPEIDGYEVARRIRQHSHLAQVPLVAVTGYGQDSDRERSLEAGLAAHIVKPVDSRKLGEILATVVRSKA